jgi:serine/threonine protein kinase
LRSFLSGTLSGLEVLHQHEAVHRDVKPPNIALRDGLWTEPVLLDLGLARLLDEQPITRYPVALGTPAFMAPEVIQGSRAGKPADVWSLGVVAHILATGRHPFYGGYADRLDETEALERLVKGPEAMTSVPPDIETLILRMLSFEANQRSSAQDARLKIRGRAAAAAEPDFVLGDKKARRAQLLL